MYDELLPRQWNSLSYQSRTYYSPEAVSESILSMIYKLLLYVFGKGYGGFSKPIMELNLDLCC